MQEPSQSPSPETVHLEQKTDSAAPSAINEKATEQKRLQEVLRRRSFRPSRKATAFGLLSVIILVGINVGVVWFIFHQSPKTLSISSPKTIDSTGQLDQLGVNKSPIGTNSVDLVITPSTEFKGNVVIDKQLQLSGKLSVSDASIAGLQAGSTSLTQLNVSGPTAVGDLGLRGNLIVTGSSHFQGAVAIDSLLSTVGLNVGGNLNVGGSLTTNNFSARSLTSSSTLTIGGHIITRGSTPSIIVGGVGNGGTVNISGNDSSGIIHINTGSGPSNGPLATIRFATAFTASPNVVISPVGPNTGSLLYYLDQIGPGGFVIGANNTLAGADYTFTYIVMQ